MANCQKCGGQVNHLVTDVKGKRVYVCNNGLTRGGKIDHRTGDLIPTFISSCGHMQDEFGRNIPDGSVIYFTHEASKNNPDKLNLAVKDFRVEGSMERL